MDKRKYSSDLKETHARLVQWKYMAIGLLVSNILLSIFVITKDYSEKTIVIPSEYGVRAETSEGFWVKGNEASPSYIEAMAREFAIRSLTFHPKNVRAQFDHVVLHAHPSVYSDLKAKYDVDADRVEKGQLSSSFHIMRIQVQGMKAVVSGVLESKVGKQTLEDKVAHFELSFVYEGKVYLNDFRQIQTDRREEDEVSKNETH